MPDEPRTHPTIEVRIDKPVVSATHFIHMAAAMLDLVNSVALELRGAPNARAPRWNIRELKTGSAAMVAELDAEDDVWRDTVMDRAISTAKNGMQQLADPSKPRPAHFNKRALKSAETIAKIASKVRSGTTVLRFGGAAVEPSPHVVARVQEMQRAKFKSIGAVEGKLEMITSSEGYHTAIRTRDNHSVRCVFDEAQKEKVREYWDHDVIARGILWSREDGTRIELELRDLEPFKEVEPALVQQMRGILGGYERAE